MNHSANVRSSVILNRKINHHDSVCVKSNHSELIKFLWWLQTGQLALTSISVLMGAQCITPRVQGIKCVIDATLFTTRGANLLLVYSLLQQRMFPMSYDTTRSVSDIIKFLIRVSVARSAALCQRAIKSPALPHKAEYRSQQRNQERTEASSQELTALRSKHQHTPGLKLRLDSSSVITITRALDCKNQKTSSFLSNLLIPVEGQCLNMATGFKKTNILRHAEA